MTDIKGTRRAVRKVRKSAAADHMLQALQEGMKQPVTEQIAELRKAFARGCGHSLVSPLPPQQLLSAFMTFTFHQMSMQQVMIGRLLGVVHKQQVEINHLFGEIDEVEEPISEGDCEASGNAEGEQQREESGRLDQEQAEGQAQPQGSPDAVGGEGTPQALAQAQG